MNSRLIWARNPILFILKYFKKKKKIKETSICYFVSTTLVAGTFCYVFEFLTVEHYQSTKLYSSTSSIHMKLWLEEWLVEKQKGEQTFSLSSFLLLLNIEILLLIIVSFLSLGLITGSTVKQWLFSLLKQWLEGNIFSCVCVCVYKIGLYL